MNSQRKAVAVLIFSILAGCGHSGTVPVSSANGSTDAAGLQRGALSIVTTGNFTEYSLPSGIMPTDLTRGPYNTIYFVNPNGAPAKVYQLVEATGVIHAFTAPAPYENFGGAIINYNKLTTFVVIDRTVPGDAFSFAHVTTTGQYSFTGAEYFEDRPPTNLVLSSNGTLTFGWCIDPCDGNDGAVNETRLPGNFVPQWVTPGPNGNIYATAGNNDGVGPGMPDTNVYAISTSGAILNTFALPLGTSPNGPGTPVSITTGADHNLWITEPGLNKIARMTPTGTITQFTVPTPNAGLDRITKGGDGAVFFTETNANKLGRITTTGSITEYAIPTANSGATGITPCTTNCGTHGGVWFTETNANKIAKFNAPI